MRYLIIFFILIFLPAALFALVFWQEAQIPSAVTGEVQNFIRTELPEGEIGAIVPAHRPWQFGPEAEASIYPQSVRHYFQDRQVNYPAQEAWCVYLDTPAPADKLVVSLHTDLYVSDWILHQPADPQAVFAEIGCEPAP